MMVGGSKPKDDSGEGGGLGPIYEQPLQDISYLFSICFLLNWSSNKDHMFHV